MKNIKFLILVAYGFFVATFFSCAPKAFTVESPDPLNEPGYLEPTVEDFHLKNLKAITNNPAYQAR